MLFSPSPGERRLISLLAKGWQRSEADICLDAFRRGFKPVAEDFELFCKLDQVSPALYDSLAQAIALNWDALTGSRISPERLIALKSGETPTELEQVRLALALNLPESAIEKLVAPETHDTTLGTTPSATSE